MLIRSRDLSGPYQSPGVGAELDWNHPLTRGLVACWPLWGRDLTRDYARGNGNSLLTNNNGVSLTGENGLTTPPGILGLTGNSGRFVTASAQSLSAVSNADLQTGNIDWTVSFWLNPAANANDFLISKLGSLNANREYQIYRGGVSNNQITMDWWTNATGSSANVISSNTLALSAWALAFVWHNASANNINIQTFHAATHTYSTVATTGATGGNAGTAALYIGSRELAGVTTYGGNLAQVQIRKLVLTPAERLWLFEEPLALYRRQTHRVYSIPATATGRSFAVIVG